MASATTRRRGFVQARAQLLPAPEHGAPAPPQLPASGPVFALTRGEYGKDVGVVTDLGQAVALGEFKTQPDLWT